MARNPKYSHTGLVAPSKGSSSNDDEPELLAICESSELLCACVYTTW